MTEHRPGLERDSRLGFDALACPVRDLSILLAMPVFGLIFTIGVVGGFPGHALALITLPAFFALLLQVTEARRQDRPVDPPSIEMFTLAEGALGLVPLMICALAAAGIHQLTVSGLPLLAGVLLFAFQAYLPLLLANLVVTGSVHAGINPLGLYRVLRVLGADYFVILGSSLAAALPVFALQFFDSPLFFKAVAIEYWFFVVAAAAGAGLWHNAERYDVELEEDIGRALTNLDRHSAEERQAILNRAYGFASHSNKVGAVKLLLDEVRAGGPDAEEFAAYMEAVFSWDVEDTALIFACYYLDWLLQEGYDSRACKLLQRCRYLDANFDLRHVEQAKVLVAVRRTGNRDLEEWLIASGRVAGD